MILVSSTGGLTSGSFFVMVKTDRYAKFILVKPFDMSLPYLDYPLPVWFNILELLFFKRDAADSPTLLEGSYFSLVNADLLGKSAEFFSMAMLASLPWYSFRTEMNVLLIRMFFIGTFFLAGDGVLTLFAKLLEAGWRWSYIYVL